MNDSELNLSQVVEAESYRSFLLQSRFWVQRVLVPFLMTIGVIGNGITIVIMTRRRMRSSTNYYLAALAIFDMMYLIFTFFLSLKHYPNVSDPNYHAYWTLMPFIFMLVDTSSNTSVWLTVTFTVERYVAVCHPMKGKVFCTESRAKKAIVIVFLFCFLCTLTTPFEWKVVEVFNNVTNHTRIRITHTELANNYLYKTIFYWWTVVFFTFVPFILLAIFNSFLIRSVHQSKVQRSSMTRGDTADNSQENKITIMLIAVVILFFFCQSPTACHLLYSSTQDENIGKSQHNLMVGLGNIFNFLMMINAAGNFVLYCLLSQKYRKTFVQIFCPCLRDKRNALNSMYYPSTVVSNVDTDSPGSCSSRRMSNARFNKLNSPKGSNSELDNGRRDSPAGNSKSVFLQVPRQSATQVVYDDDDDSMTDDSNRRHRSCGRIRKMVSGPWRHLKQSMGIEEKKTREQVIPLKGGGNKCIVITAPEGIPDPQRYSNNSTV